MIVFVIVFVVALALALALALENLRDPAGFRGASAITKAITTTNTKTICD